MDCCKILNKEELSIAVINELKLMGVKYRKEKKSKQLPDKKCNRRIFRVPLHLLEVTEVILANGNVVQIPIFVADACNRILEQVETEGIFRKAGSSVRQKEIRVMLEAGMPLGKSHHVIDVANIVKYFFRELPEPLLSSSMQETLLRSLLIGEDHTKAILLACLLLPSIALNTLRFFMQFLYTVSLSESSNKMSAENLAIIFTPGLMPFANINSHRFANHLKVVQLLIENANSIGIIPSHISNMLDPCSHLNLSKGDGKFVVSTPYSNCADLAAKKKKKRRSGSLTHMFNGFKKIVGSAIGSSEDLDDIPKGNKANINKSNVCSTPFRKNGETHLLEANVLSATPCQKANKKRKFVDPVCAFSNKKKRDLLALLPNNSGGFLPNTPLMKENKKHPVSVNGNRRVGNESSNAVVTSMERRWSIVGSGWSKYKNKQATDKTQHNSRGGDCMLNTENADNQLQRSNADIKNSSSVSKKITNDICLSPTSCQNEQYAEDFASVSAKNSEAGIMITQTSECGKLIDAVAATGTYMIQNLDDINNSIHLTSQVSIDSSGLEGVQTRYERMLEETASLTLRANVELPRRKSRDLKIRRSDQQEIRSPSARKIGSIRRRSHDKNRLKHLSNTSITNGMMFIKELSHLDGGDRKLLQNTFYNKRHLTSYRQSVGVTTSDRLNQDSNINGEVRFERNACAEKWISADEFFKTLTSSTNEHASNHVEHAKTPVNRKTECNTVKTPMSAFESVSCKSGSERITSIAVVKPATTSRVPFVNRIPLATPIEDDSSGRASISRLRTLNAGMVMAKARLFDGLGSCSSSYVASKVQRHEPQPKHRSLVSADQHSKKKQALSEDSVATSTPNGAQRKSTFRNTPGSKQQQGKNLNPVQRRQNFSTVRNINKVSLQLTHNNKERLHRQRNVKERTPIGISDLKFPANFSRQNDTNSPRISKRRQQRENSSYKSNHSDFSTQNRIARKLHHHNSPK